MNTRPTTLYREVPIEDLEQAKALPHGTIARIQLENGDWTVLALSDLQHPGKPQQRFWFATFSMNAYLDDALVGGIALVPVEATGAYSTAESRATWCDDGVYGSPEDVRRDQWTGPIEVEWRTPWEKA